MQDIKIVNGYTTADLYRAAALICDSGVEPDKLIPSPSDKARYFKVYLLWNDRNVLPLDKLENKKLKIEPLKFKEIHRELVFKVRELVNNYYKEIDNNGNQKKVNQPTNS